VPGQDPTTCTGPVDYLCLSPTATTAWNLSAATDWTPDGDWDLWVVRLVDEYDVRLRIEDGLIVEAHVFDPIPPARLWRIGTRNTIEIAEVTA
jgi:hypothetical protein